VSDFTAPSTNGPGTANGAAGSDELTAMVDAMTALWEDVKITAKKLIEGDLEDIPYADRPEVLIGVAFAGGLVTALTIRLLGRR
jgi:hypothetical protein